MDLTATKEMLKDYGGLEPLPLGFLEGSLETLLTCGWKRKDIDALFADAYRKCLKEAKAAELVKEIETLYECQPPFFTPA